MMNDKEKNKKQLMTELTGLRQQMATLEKENAGLRADVKKLRASELKYRIVADNTFDWEFWISPEADFIYSSPSCERITGYRADEFVDDRSLFLRIVHPEDLTRVAELLNRRRIEKGFFEIEFRIFHRNGKEKWIALASIGAHDEDGRYLGIRGSNREISGPKGK